MQWIQIKTLFYCHCYWIRYSFTALLFNSCPNYAIKVNNFFNEKFNWMRKSEPRRMTKVNWIIALLWVSIVSFNKSAWSIISCLLINWLYLSLLMFPLIPNTCYPLILNNPGLCSLKTVPNNLKKLFGFKIFSGYSYFYKLLGQLENMCSIIFEQEYKCNRDWIMLHQIVLSKLQNQNTSSIRMMYKMIDLCRTNIWSDEHLVNS